MDFLLRPWQESDIESVAKHADNKKIADNLRDAFPHPYRYEDAAAYVRSCLDAPEEKQCVRAIEVNGEAVGSIGVFVFGMEFFVDRWLHQLWSPSWSLVVLTICIGMVIPLIIIRRVPALREEARRRFHL